MNDEDKPREQLIHELEEMRRALAKSEESVSEVKRLKRSYRENFLNMKSCLPSEDLRQMLPMR